MMSDVGLNAASSIHTSGAIETKTKIRTSARAGKSRRRTALFILDPPEETHGECGDDDREEEDDDRGGRADTRLEILEVLLVGVERQHHCGVARSASCRNVDDVEKPQNVDHPQDDAKENDASNGRNLEEAQHVMPFN